MSRFAWARPIWGQCPTMSAFVSIVPPGVMIEQGLGLCVDRKTLSWPLVPSGPLLIETRDRNGSLMALASVIGPLVRSARDGLMERSISLGRAVSSEHIVLGDLGDHGGEKSEGEMDGTCHAPSPGSPCVLPPRPRPRLWAPPRSGQWDPTRLWLLSPRSGWGAI